MHRVSRAIMVVGGGASASGSIAGSSNMYGAMGPPASETDGETLDGEADYDDYDEWDYVEMFATLSKNVKTYILQPLVVGASAAFGMSIGEFISPRHSLSLLIHTPFLPLSSYLT